MAEQNEESFGSLLRDYRALANFSQEQLAERSGLTVHAISMLEREIRRSPRPRTVVQLADALQLDARRRRKLVEAARPRRIAAHRPSRVVRPATASATRALPRGVASFTGRERELELLVTIATEPRGPDRGVRISAIDGMAGVGKTAFAVHAAHRLAPAFTDGQLFLDLHAHAAGQRPTTAAEALGTLLLAVGVAAERVPNDEEARMTLWRDSLAGRRVLIVLDDAASHHQVRPLLPGSAGCMVLVTSRRRLAGLEDVEPLTVEPLPPAEAADLFLRLAGSRSGSVNPTGVAALTAWCGCLPLAIRLLASKLRSHPAWTVQHLVNRLEHTSDPLGELRVDDVDVAAAFELSYQDVTPEQQRLFRRLGLHPGREVDAYAAAALDDVHVAAGREGLESLYDHHLVEEPRAGRYRLHDLLVAFARSQTARDAASDNEAAIHRLLDYYLHLTAGAARHFAEPGRPVPPPIEGEARDLPDLSTPERALTLMNEECANLAACVVHAAANGRPVPAGRLVRAMQPFLLFAGRLDQALDLGHTALAASTVTGDRLGRARALYDLGVAQGLASRYQEATASLSEALAISRDVGERRGQANALHGMGVLQRLTGRYTAATASLSEACAIFRDLEDRPGQAAALQALGAVQHLVGAYAAARASLKDALRVFRDIGSRRCEAEVLVVLGTLQCDTGSCSEARTSLSEAVRICRDLGARPGLADALVRLGNAQHLLGDRNAAVAALTDALSTFRDIGDRRGEAEERNHLCAVLLGSGRPADGLQQHREALRLAREIGAPLEEARGLEGSGRCLIGMGESEEGTATQERALSVYQRLRVPASPDGRRDGH